MTAKSARPDANRAADGMMRALAEGRVRWCFWPPGSQPQRDGQGLWLGEWHGEDSELESFSEHDSDGPTRPSQEVAGDDDEDDASDEEPEAVKLNNASFFAALSLDNAGDDDDDDLPTTLV